MAKSFDYDYWRFKEDFNQIEIQNTNKLKLPKGRKIMENVKKYLPLGIFAIALAMRHNGRIFAFG